MLTMRFEKLDVSKHGILCVKTKKLIVPPKNIPCFDAHKDTPRISFFIAFSQDVQVFLMEKASPSQHPCLRLSRLFLNCGP